MHRTLCHTLALAASLTLIASRSDAAWIPNGNPVCTASGAQLAPAIVTDGASGALLVWRDLRRGGLSDLYAQHLLADGTTAPGWPANGALVTQSGNVQVPQVVPDGAGGALVLWAERMAFPMYGVFAQRIQADGTIAPGWPANGRLITSDMEGPGGFFLTAASDGSGGAYFVRTRFDFTLFRMLLTRIDANGAYASGWTEAGQWIESFEANVGNLRQFKVVPDETGGVLVGRVIFTEVGIGFFQLGRTLRVLPNGTTAFNNALSGPTFPGSGSTSGIVQSVSVAADGSGGEFVTWRVAGNPSALLFGQHFDASGAALWPLDTPSPLSGVPVADGSGGTFIIGPDPSGVRLEAHRRLSGGGIAPGWSAAGLALGDPPAGGDYRAMRSGTRAIVGWVNANGATGLDVRATVVQSDGTVAPGWAPGGTLVCSAPLDQTALDMTGDASNGAFVCWQDARSGAAGADIYATRLVPDGPVPALASVALAAYRDGRADLRWYAANEREEASVERTEDGASWQPIGLTQFDAEGFAAFSDATVQPGRRYGYRLTAQGSAAVWPGSLAWVEIPGALAFGVRALSPNPAGANVSVSFALGASLPATIELIDVSGRVVQRHAIAAGDASERTLPIPLAGTRDGVYWLRLTQGDRSQSVRLARVH